MARYKLNRDDGLYTLFEYDGVLEIKFKPGKGTEYKAEDLTFPQLISTISDLIITSPAIRTPFHQENNRIYFDYFVNGERSTGEHLNEPDFQAVTKLSSYVSELLHRHEKLEKMVDEQRDSIDQIKQIVS